jgi:hypothetical protein
MRPSQPIHASASHEEQKLARLDLQPQHVGSSCDAASVTRIRMSIALGLVALAVCATDPAPKNRWTFGLSRAASRPGSGSLRVRPRTSSTESNLLVPATIVLTALPLCVPLAQDIVLLPVTTPRDLLWAD